MDKKEMMGVTFNGTVTFNGPMFDIHDNENVYLSVDKAKVNVNENENQNANKEVPDVLACSELWERVKNEGLVDENNMPTISRPEAALLVDMLAEKLGIGNKWKLFEELWNRKNMRNDYNTALEQRKSLKFQEELKNILR